MRKIIDPSSLHNAASPRPLALILVLALAAALVGAGCGGDSGGQAGQATADPDACPVSVDLGGWQAFSALCARIAAGETPPEADLAALGEQPAFVLWRQAMAPNVPSALRVGNWVEEAFWPESGRDNDERKLNADRRAIGANFRWAWDRRARVDSLAALLAGPEAGCAILARTAGWIDPARLPAPLPIHVLPGKPELRFHEGHVFVDTGVLAAGLPSQLERQLAGLLYRNLAAEDGTNPLEAEGDLAVAHTFRILRNEGIAAWIEELPHTHFDPEHPRLRRVRPVPEFFYETTLRTLEVTSEGLPRLFADPAEMQAQGGAYARTIAAGGRPQPGRLRDGGPDRRPAGFGPAAAGRPFGDGVRGRLPGGRAAQRRRPPPAGRGRPRALGIPRPHRAGSLRPAAAGAGAGLRPGLLTTCPNAKGGPGGPALLLCPSRGRGSVVPAPNTGSMSTGMPSSLRQRRRPAPAAMPP